jgi:hypothetical protein
MRRLVMGWLFVVGLSGVWAQPFDPSTLPRLERTDLVNVGGFKTPNTDNNGSFNYGGSVLAMALDGASLYLSNEYRVAQISIPAPVLSNSIAALPRATYVKPFVQVLGGGRGDGVGPLKADKLGGLLVLPDRILTTAYVYYDANNTQQKSHARVNPDFSDIVTPRIWSQVWQPKSSGFVAGSMTAIPPEWRAKLGGPALTGLCCVPIVTRTSFGPAAYVFDPAQVGQMAVTATPLVYYPSDHPNLGPWSGSNPTYGGTTEMGGMVIVPGTRTLLFFGSNGIGPNCYGDGTKNPASAGPNNTEPCYDPTMTDKGSHAYPYKYQIWAYDLAELVAVKEGKTQPWDVKPYGVWPIDLPIMHGFQVRFSSPAIDPKTRRIYVAQYKGEIAPDGGGLPIVWAFDPKVGTTLPPIPPIDPPKPPIDPPKPEICKDNPLVVTVSAWPSATEGSRQLRYTATVSGKVVTMADLHHIWTAPQRLQVTDGRGCSVTVQK